MQRIFQSSLLERVPSYSERVCAALALREAPVNDTAGILQEFCSANIVSLRHLAESIPATRWKRPLPSRRRGYRPRR